MKKLLPYLKEFIPSIVLCVIMVMLDTFAETYQPTLMSNIIDNGVARGDMGEILKIGGIMVGMALLAILAGSGSVIFSTKAGIGFGAKLREKMFSKVSDYSFKNIDTFSTSSLVTRLTNDVNAVQMTAMMALRMMTRAPFMLLFSIIMAMRINVRLGLIVVVAIPILVLVLVLILKKGFPLFTKMQEAIDKVNATVQEGLTNIRVIKSFVRTDFEKKKFKDVNNNLMDKAIKANSVVVLTMPVLMLVMNLATLAVWWFGGNIYLAGGIKIGELNAFVNYITQILFSLMMLSMTIMQFSRAKASANRINEVLDAEIDIKNPSNSEKSTITKGLVEFKNVSFKYDTGEGEPVLKNITFTANPGETVAIIGATGSAKSTLVQLIPRLYDVTEGEILIDGKNVKDYNLDDLRGGIGMVLQKNVLFSGTIRENILWGKPGATQEEIETACKNAQAHDFILSFPDGYDTRLEQGGVNVSGGQKQRLCIARAMIKQPPILIMDDSTSAVDTATEQKIRQSFQNDLSHTTKFIIAQRVSSVSYADKILVLDDGELVGIGTHEELLANNGVYQEIVSSQQKKGVSA